MKRVFVISRTSWTVWLGMFFTLVAISVTASLSIAAFRSGTVNALREVRIVQELTSAKQIDQLARAKYLTEQEDKRIAEKLAQEQAEAAAKTNNSSSTAKSNAVRAASNPAPAQACDRLIIPKIGLNACLATVGLATNGAVDVHSSLPAWFNQSSRAGTRNGTYSATFIDGHRSGIFRNLGRLAIGDTVTVTFINGESYIYTVRATETTMLDQTDMGKALSVYGGAAQGLNLMTCDGAYSAKAGTAERRLTVYATR